MIKKQNFSPLLWFISPPLINYSTFIKSLNFAEIVFDNNAYDLFVCGCTVSQEEQKMEWQIRKAFLWHF
jgi:hypothetical protein